MACSTTATVTFGDRTFRLNFFAQYLITLCEESANTMFISMGPVRDVVDYTSTGRLIGYYFQKRAWAEQKCKPHNKAFGERLNRFENLSFHIMDMKAKQIDQDTNLPMGPPPVGLVEITFGFQWKDSERMQTASQVMSFQTITPEQFACKF
jgi:hypothetical protein